MQYNTIQYNIISEKLNCGIRGNKTTTENINCRNKKKPNSNLAVNFSNALKILFKKKRETKKQEKEASPFCKMKQQRHEQNKVFEQKGIPYTVIHFQQCLLWPPPHSHMMQHPVNSTPHDKQWHPSSTTTHKNHTEVPCQR